ELKPPAGEVSHGRLRKIAAETLSQYSTRNSYLIRECSNRPRIGGLAMQESQGFPDLWVADSGQPPGLFAWEQRDIPSQCLDEQDLRQLGEKGLVTRSRRIHIIHRIADGVFQPLA